MLVLADSRGQPIMRWLAWGCLVTVLGCNPAPGESGKKPDATQQAALAQAEADQEVSDPVPISQPGQPDALSRIPPPDLGTRKRGGDWPGFLGPAGTSVSSETGI